MIEINSNLVLIWNETYHSRTWKLGSFLHSSSVINHNDDPKTPLTFSATNKCQKQGSHDFFSIQWWFLWSIVSSYLLLFTSKCKIWIRLNYVLFFDQESSESETGKCECLSSYRQQADRTCVADTGPLSPPQPRVAGGQNGDTDSGSSAIAAILCILALIVLTVLGVVFVRC